MTIFVVLMVDTARSATMILNSLHAASGMGLRPYSHDSHVAWLTCTRNAATGMESAAACLVLLSVAALTGGDSGVNGVRLLLMIYLLTFAATGSAVMLIPIQFEFKKLLCPTRSVKK